MNLFSRWFGKKAGSDAPRGRNRIGVVDASGMVDARQRTGGAVSPREHFAILRMLAQFAEREGVELQAVFTGRPLREAGEGQTFKGVRVFYAESAAQAQARIREMVRASLPKREVLVFTADSALEQAARDLGAACMRLSTLRKSIDERTDSGDRPERGERDRGNRDRNDRARGPRDRGPRQPQPPSSAPSAPPAPPVPAEPGSQGRPDEPAKPSAVENPTVLDLIDPV